MSNQRGFTFLGMVMLLSTLAVVAIIALRVVPPYIEYFSLKKIVKEVSLTASESVSDAELRGTFEKRLDINSITRVTPRDLAIERGPRGIVLTLAYSVKQPLVAQVSLCIDFEAQASNKP